MIGKYSHSDFFSLSDYNFFWPNAFPAFSAAKADLETSCPHLSFLSPHLIFTSILIQCVIFSDSSHTQTRVPPADCLHSAPTPNLLPIEIPLKRSSTVGKCGNGIHVYSHICMNII